MNKIQPKNDQMQVGKALKWLSLLLEPAVKEVILHLTVPKYFEENRWTKPLKIGSFRS